MNTMRNILAMAAAGLMVAGAGTAEAGVAISVSFGSRVPPQPVVVQPAIVQPAVVQPVIAQPAVMDLPNDQTVYPLSGFAGTWAYFRIYVPAGQTYLNVTTAGGAGDLDLYVAHAQWPAAGREHLVSGNLGTEEEVTVLHPAAGWWNVMVYGRTDYRDVSLLASWWRSDYYYHDQYYDMPVTQVVVPATSVRVIWHADFGRRLLRGVIPTILRRLYWGHDGRGHVRHPVVQARPTVVRVPPARVVTPA